MSAWGRAGSVSDVDVSGIGGMIVCGDAQNIPLADRSVQYVVTSPPYWGLRDYLVRMRLYGVRTVNRAAILGLALLAGCATYQNQQRIGYLENHPGVDVCIMQEGVDPPELLTCLGGEAGVPDVQALKDCAGRKWRLVAECILASKERDRMIAALTAPQTTANDLGMIGLGAYLSQGPPTVNIYER
jgi:hypothetical protein